MHITCSCIFCFRKPSRSLHAFFFADIGHWFRWRCRCRTRWTIAVCMATAYCPRCCTARGSIRCWAASPRHRTMSSCETRNTWHKHLPHICQDLQCIVEMLGRGLMLCSQPTCSTCNAAAVGVGVEDAMAAAYENFFPAVWAWLLRMGQGMNPLNRKASGGHVEYEIWTHNGQQIE